MLNGTSTAGLAAQAGQSLQDAGFVIGTTTNASVSDLQRSQVLRVAGQDAAANIVARQLGIAEIVDADSVSMTIAGSADVIVLVGADRQ